MADTRFTPQFLNEPVAKHVRTDFTILDPAWTIGEALEHLRASPPPGRVIYFYVVDSENHLLGVVPTRRLLLNPQESRIDQVMIRKVVAIPADATVLEACEFFTMHRYLAMPVVDGERRLIGLVDVELYTDELAGLPSGGGDQDASLNSRDEVFQLIGVHLSTASQSRPLPAFRGRFPWLMCNIGGGLLAAVLSGFYDDVLTWRNAVFALFVPVVLALAESVAIQSVTLALQALRAGKPSWRRLVIRLGSEMTTGILLGVASAFMVAGVAAVWRQDLTVWFVLMGGISISVTAAALIGLSVPYVLRLLNRDPQVAAGPIALASADCVTLLAYFNLARLLA